MYKLLIALLLSIASTSYAATANDGSSAASNPDSQVQKQQNKIEKNNKKTNSEKARQTKSKDKGMHIKDEVTDTIQNEPADAVEIKSPSPTVEQK